MASKEAMPKMPRRTGIGGQRVDARQNDVIGIDPLAGPADREMLVWESEGGKRGDRLPDCCAYSAAVAERAIEARCKRARHVVADRASHADDTIDYSTKCLGRIIAETGIENYHTC